MTVKEQAQMSANALMTNQNWLGIVAYMKLQNIDAVADFTTVDLFAPDAMQKLAKYQGEVKARLDFILDVNQLADEYRRKQEDIE